MGERLGGVIRLVIVLAVGIFVGSAISQWRPLPESERVLSPRNVTSEGLGRVRVEVLNAGGEDGMARLATEHLRDQGFDVVFFGNAEVSVAAVYGNAKVSGTKRLHDRQHVDGKRRLFGILSP